MDHFPIFLSLASRRVAVVGGGEVALAKLRLLLKTSATLDVYARDPAPEIVAAHAADRLILHRRDFTNGDAVGAALVYAATGSATEDARIATIARAEAAQVNLADNLKDSDFITPAIVDRDPLVVAIGTEGAAPVLARKVKADVEARISPIAGTLARIGRTYRTAAEALPGSRARRAFWSEYYETTGPAAFARGGGAAVREALPSLLSRHLERTDRPGRVELVGAGPGDPELLTLKARRALDRADVVIHDHLVAPAILELARREAKIVEAGKVGFGPSMSQEKINALMIAHAAAGALVVRLKAGDPGIFGRLDEEIEALDAAGIDWSIIPGITSAVAAAAAIGQSLTRRERNGTLRLLTGHDVRGFAEQDWRGLSAPGTVAAIYMGKSAARFLQGRLLMHGADAQTPVTVVENVSRPEQMTRGCRLIDLPEAVASLDGPAVLLYGLAPRAAAAKLSDLREALS